MFRHLMDIVRFSSRELMVLLYYIRNGCRGFNDLPYVVRQESNDTECVARQLATL